MVIVIDKKLREKIREKINKQCPLCGRDIFASDDFVYTKHKQGETIVHEKCYESLIRRGKKKMSEEDAIRILKEAIELYEEAIELYEDCCYISTDEDFKAIETILYLSERQKRKLVDYKERLQRANKAIDKMAEHIVELQEKLYDLDMLKRI